jgi:hypothetical protein
MFRKVAALVGAVALSGTLTLAVQSVQPGGETITAGSGMDGTRVTVVAGQHRLRAGGTMPTKRQASRETAAARGRDTRHEMLG